mgnify:CR=1 FL=1
MKEIEYKESLSFCLVRFLLFALSLHQKEKRFLIFLVFLEKEFAYITEICLQESALWELYFVQIYHKKIRIIK